MSEQFRPLIVPPIKRNRKHQISLKQLKAEWSALTDRMKRTQGDFINFTHRRRNGLINARGYASN